MIFSDQHQLWLVHPTQHTNYIDVADWCHNLWGHHSVDGKHEGTWSYGHGDYYNLTQEIGRAKILITDTRLFFSFKNEDDAVLFALRWA
jgi:hypothetical protein